MPESDELYLFPHTTMTVNQCKNQNRVTVLNKPFCPVSQTVINNEKSINMTFAISDYIVTLTSLEHSTNERE